MGADTMIAVTAQKGRAMGLKVLLSAETLILIIAYLLVHYGGIPFKLSDQATVWCIDHGGLPVSAASDYVQVNHTLWPLGITCTYKTTTVAYPDRPATYWDYGFLITVLTSAAATVPLLIRARRRTRINSA